jgi:tetratricopeptide (TPR) repeat protein
VGLTVLLGAQTTALGDEPPVAVSQENHARSTSMAEQGTTLYRAHDYRAAIEKFIQAYAFDPDPNLLYNVAKCYESLGDRPSAINKYEEFLGKPGGDIDGRKRAEEAIKTLKAPPPGSTPASTAAKPAEPSLPAARPGDAPAAHARLAVPAWIALGVGVAAAVTGTVFYAMGASDHANVTGAAGYGSMTQVASLTQVQAQAYADSGTEKKTIGVIGWGVGGAAVVTSAVLFLLDRRAPTESKIAWSLAPNGSGAAAVLRGSF